MSRSWRVDETDVKVRNTWAYLYRAVDKHGDTVGFCLSPTPNAKAARRFLRKALNGLNDWQKQMRGIATRCDQALESDLETIKVATIRLWIRTL